MPTELQIIIQPTGTIPRVRFVPSPLNVSIGGQQKFFWSNEDSEPHWPVAVVNGQQRPDIFGITGPIPGKPPDGPAPTSDAVFLQTPGTFNYVCAIAGHNGETGTIVTS
jgi:plastocyanin